MPGSDQSRFKAVIFDIGGVLVGSPFAAIAEYEKAHGLPPNYINCLITAYGENGAYQRFERGEVGLSAFYDAWQLELGDVEEGNKAYRAYAARRSLPMQNLPTHLGIDARELFSQMMAKSQVPDEAVVNAVRRVREQGLRVVALTNNYSKEDDDLKNGITSEADRAEHERLGWATSGEGVVPSRVRALFDDWVDSSVEGLRKPDPQFFHLAFERNGLQPSECIFLDDIGANLRTAAELGMTAIQVPLGNSAKALRELEDKLGFDVTSPAHVAKL